MNIIKNTLKKMRHIIFYGWTWAKNTCRLKKSTVIKVIEGQTPRFSQPNLCVFAHFDRDGMVEDYVLFYLAEIAKNNFEIIFVTTSINISNLAIEKLKPFCSLIVVRENKGLDFGSFKEGILQAGDVSKYQQCLIANDSVYGPLNNLASVFTQMEEQKADLYGITDSYEMDYHLQSYFVIFNLRSIAQVDFMTFWNNVLLSNNKLFVVRHYELGLSKFFLRKKYKLAAFCSFRKLYDDVLTTPVKFNTYLISQFIDELKNYIINPVHHCWDLLIERYQCPFVKIDLIKINFYRFNNVNKYQSIIEKTSSHYNLNLIATHLNRFVRQGHA